MTQVRVGPVQELGWEFDVEANLREEIPGIRIFRPDNAGAFRDDLVIRKKLSTNGELTLSSTSDPPSSLLSSSDESSVKSLSHPGMKFDKFAFGSLTSPRLSTTSGFKDSLSSS